MGRDCPLPVHPHMQIFVNDFKIQHFMEHDFCIDVENGPEPQCNLNQENCAHKLLTLTDATF